MTTRLIDRGKPKSVFFAALLAALSASPIYGQINGTPNRLVKFTTPTTGGNSQLFDNGSNVGIGTTNPQDVLHLFRADPPRSTVGVLMGNSTTGPGRRGFLVDYHATGGAELWNFENTNMWFATNNTQRMIIGANGDVFMDGQTFYLDASTNRVGIGTANPQDVLHLFAGAKSTVGVLMGNSLASAGRGGFLIDFHSSGGAELWNFENSDMWFGTNNTKRMTISRDGRVGIGGLPTNVSYHDGTTNRPLLDVHGNMRLENIPVWDGPNDHDLTWGSGFANGVAYSPPRRLISREGSSRRYKTDIQPADEDFSKILAAQPKKYQMRKGYGPPDVWSFGYIAEDLDAAGLGNLVIYDDEGRPDGVSYKKVALYVNEVVKAQQRTIEQMRRDMATLQARMQELQERLEKQDRSDGAG